MTKYGDISAVDILARTIYGEARGEKFLGKLAVACVVMNRVHADLNNDNKPDWWGEGVKAICLKPYQFSCWLENDPNLEHITTVHDGYEDFLVCLAIAAGAMAGDFEDVTGGATHYHTKAIIPAWANGKEWSALIGNHIFYAGIES